LRLFFENFNVFFQILILKNVKFSINFTHLLDSMQTALLTGERSPPGTQVGG
jgi:hypothetical protein